MTFRQRLPLYLFRKKMCGTLALLSICATTVQAAIVFQDNFNRSGPLNGSTPSTTPGGTWTAQSGFATDGTKVNAGPAFLQSASVPMPVAITSGNIYTLYATMFRGLSGDDTAIMIFGFFDAVPSWNGSTTVDEGHAIAIAPRNNRASVQPMLNGFVSASDIPVADGTNGVTYGVRLYETAPNAWSAVAVEVAPTNQVISFAPTPISLTNIFTIGMISGSTLPPYIDNLTLEVISALLGDYNGNGVVDAADYPVWRRSLGQIGTGLAADGNNDGVVDHADFDVWRAHFGQTASGAGSGTAANAAVPEPATMPMMLLVGILAMCSYRRVKVS
jgi:hypothetical protein